MRGFFNGWIIGIILGAVGYWFIQKKAAEHPEAQQRYEQAAATAFTNAGVTASNMSDALRAKLDTLDLHGDQIKDELAKTGEVIPVKPKRGLLFRTVHLFFIRDIETGLVWMTKILTDPFNDFKLYCKAPLALLRGELIDPGLDILEHDGLEEQHA